MLVTLAGAAIGAAAALVGLAVAGGAIVGLGLLGYGENAAESMDMLKRKLGEVKSELFSSLKPAFKAMNPILDGWLDGLAGAANKLVGPLTRLAGFEGFLGGIGGGVLNWVIGFLNTISDLRPEIQAIGSVLADVFGDTSIMEWGIDELYENMGGFLQLGSILFSLIIIIYNVAKAISFAVAPFAPLFKAVASLSGLLANKWVSALLSAVFAVLLLYGSLVGLNLLLGKLTVTAALAAAAAMKATVVSVLALAKGAVVAASSGIATIIGALYAWVAAATTARMAMARLLAMTGVGAVLAIGGFLAGEAIVGGMKTNATAGDMRGGGGDGFGGYGGGMGGATINIYGDVGNSEYQKLQDEFPEMYAEESETRENADK
jgi:hypothetical protein